MYVCTYVYVRVCVILTKALVSRLSKFIVGFAFSPWVSVCVFVSRSHAGVSIYLTHAWVRETNTHTEIQG